MPPPFPLELVGWGNTRFQSNFGAIWTPRWLDHTWVENEFFHNCHQNPWDNFISAFFWHVFHSDTLSLECLNQRSSLGGLGNATWIPSRSKTCFSKCDHGSGGIVKHVFCNQQSQMFHGRKSPFLYVVFSWGLKCHVSASFCLSSSPPLPCSSQYANPGCGV